MSKYNDNRLFPDLPISNKELSNFVGHHQRRTIEWCLSRVSSLSELSKLLNVSRSCIYSWYYCKNVMSLASYFILISFLFNNEMH